MTKPQISADDMLEIARRVYPEYTVELGTISKYGVYIKRPEKIYRDQFNPSLTGTAEQKAQALDCIVAALKLGTEVRLNRFETSHWFAWTGTDFYATSASDNPLTAAMLALLESTK